MKNESQSHPKKSAVDPTDPRQAAFVSGGITGAVAGAVVGSAGGPIGTVVGTAIGGVTGAVTAEHISIDEAAENEYWESNWNERPYASTFSSYEEISPAYRAGYMVPEDVILDPDATFERSESQLRQAYEQDDQATIPWDEARPATEDAFNRVTTCRSRAPR